LKLRVTFEEPVVQMEQSSLELNGEKEKDRSRTLQRASVGSESGEQLKRPFGTFRSIMETLSGNQNNNNNYQAASQLKTSTLPLTSLGRKTTDAKGNPSSSASKGKNKAVSAVWGISFHNPRLCHCQHHRVLACAIFRNPQNNSERVPGKPNSYVSTKTCHVRVHTPSPSFGKYPKRDRKRKSQEVTFWSFNLPKWIGLWVLKVLGWKAFLKLKPPANTKSGPSLALISA
jgi:hypothetical protein